ncbi:MAG: galactose oxidase-like domain-containing protein [Methanobacteriota archaeon]
MRAGIVLVLVVTPLAGCLEAGTDGPAPAALGLVGPWSDPDADRPVDEALAATGTWLSPVDVGLAAIHATMLADGRILMFSGLASHGADGSPFLASPPNGESRVIDMRERPPVIGTPDPADGGASDLFCTTHTLLPDGRVVAVGGTRWATVPDTFVYGTPHVRVYDPATNEWSQAPDMAFDRWYPSGLLLPDGRMLIASGIGKIDDPATMVETLEVFDPATGAPEVLPASADRDLPMYPRLFVAPSGPLAGHVFFQPAGCLWCPGGNTDAEATWNFAASFDPATNEWATHDRAVFGVRNAPVTVMLPLRPPEYEARILVATGTLARGGAATPFAEITDLSTSPPSATPAAPMREGRWFANHVLLPDGNVMVVGGAKNDGVLVPGSDANPVSPVLGVELFDPLETDPQTGLPGLWRSLAPIETPRVYHSTALLLPDGRVWVAGTVPAQASTVVAERPHTTMVDVYEPPYLFRGVRPVIGSAPAEAAWGERFEVGTTDAADVASVVLVRTGAVTHVYNPEQRLIELVVAERGSDRLVVEAPPDANLAPPGTYMLFLLADRGSGVVPSVATMLQIGGTAL